MNVANIHTLLGAGCHHDMVAPNAQGTPLDLQLQSTHPIRWALTY
jgi:hypothetical protein